VAPGRRGKSVLLVKLLVVWIASFGALMSLFAFAASYNTVAYLGSNQSLLKPSLASASREFAPLTTHPIARLEGLGTAR
jgi:hypothetical protein